VYERFYETAEELELAFEIEAQTDDRQRDALGDIHLVAPEDRITGPGATPVMASFTHLGFGSRFANQQFGAYYAGDSLETAIAETVYHKEIEMAAAKEESIELTMRCYVGAIALPMHDIRGPEFNNLHDPDPAQYGVTQGFAARLRAEGSNGLLYRSVRAEGGECIAAFKPKAVVRPVQGGHLKYFWDGTKQRITHWARVSDAHLLDGR